MNPWNRFKHSQIEGAVEAAGRFRDLEEAIEAAIMRYPYYWPRGGEAVKPYFNVALTEDEPEGSTIGLFAWDYKNWVEVERRDGAGGIAWRAKDGGLTYEDTEIPIFNYPERESADFGGSEEYHGSGYKYSELREGFTINPIPPRVVRVFTEQPTSATGRPEIEYWMDIPNKVGGMCP